MHWKYWNEFQMKIPAWPQWGLLILRLCRCSPDLLIGVLFANVIRQRSKERALVASTLAQSWAHLVVWAKGQVRGENHLRKKTHTYYAYTYIYYNVQVDETRANNCILRFPYLTFPTPDLVEMVMPVAGQSSHKETSLRTLWADSFMFHIASEFRLKFKNLVYVCIYS